MYVHMCVNLCVVRVCVFTCDCAWRVRRGVPLWGVHVTVCLCTCVYVWGMCVYECVYEYLCAFACGVCVYLCAVVHTCICVLRACGE